MNKNDEVKVSDIIEDLKVVKLSLHKYVDCVEIEYDKRKLVDMIYYRDSSERYETSKNDKEALTDADEESEEMDKIYKEE